MEKIIKLKCPSCHKPSELSGDALSIKMMTRRNAPRICKNCGGSNPLQSWINEYTKQEDAPTPKTAVKAEVEEKKVEKRVTNVTPPQKEVVQTPHDIPLTPPKPTQSYTPPKPAAPASKVIPPQPSFDDDNNPSVTVVQEVLFNEVIGALVNEKKSEMYRLSSGKNIIGRKAATSEANIQIKTDNKKISRSHSQIDVKLSNDGYIYILSNAKNLNPTYVNGRIINNGDEARLENGDTITMADLSLMFVLIDDDRTDIQTN